MKARTSSGSLSYHQKMKPTLAIMNRSTVVPDAAFPPVVAANQKQVSGDFAEYYGKDASLVFVAKSEQPPVGSWQIVVSDTVPMAGALGYHDFTKEGNPIGKVGAMTSMKANALWAVTLSHEILEMLADPDIIRAAFVQQTAVRAMIFAYEICDPVEADELAYEIDGVKVSDFVTEQWFEPHRVGVPFSFRKTVQRPMTLAPGGYISVYRPGGGRWQQINARADLHPPGAATEELRNIVYLAHRAEVDDERAIRGRALPYSKIPNVGSRRERRNRARAEWCVSTEDSGS